MWTWPELRDLHVRVTYVPRVYIASLLETSRAGVASDDLQRVCLACVAHEALDTFGDVMDVAGPHFSAIRTRADDTATADHVVELLALVEPVLLVQVARQELRP